MISHIPSLQKDSYLLQKNRIIAPILLGLTIFLGIFFVRPQYQGFVEKNAGILKLENELKTLQSEYDAL